MINVNGTDYEIDDLTDEQKHLVGQVQRCKQQSSDCLAQAQVYQVAEKSFGDALVASLEAETVEE